MKLLIPSEDFFEETFSQFNNRYSGFGKLIFAKILEEIPRIFLKLKFYRRLHFQTEDSYAQYTDNNCSFVIQLDPLCEVIVIWDDDKQIEIGSWSANEYEEALSFIKSEWSSLI